MTSADLIFWYTGWIAWAVIAAVLAVAVILAGCAATYKAYRATVNHWWMWCVVAKLRDVYKLTPEKLRRAVMDINDDSMEAQRFIETARKVVRDIDHASTNGLDPATWTNNCKWWKEGESWFALCGGVRPLAHATPFKDGFDYCPACGRGITQCSEKP